MNYQKQVKQLRLDFVREKEERHIPAKRVDIVSVKMVKECSLMYKDRVVGSPRDGFHLIRVNFIIALFKNTKTYRISKLYF